MRPPNRRLEWPRSPGKYQQQFLDPVPPAEGTPTAARTNPLPAGKADSCSSFAALPFLGGSFFLTISSRLEVNLAINVVGDDVVPVGEAGVQFVDPLLAVGDLLLVLVLPPLVLLLDPGALGLVRPSSRRPSSWRLPLRPSCRRLLRAGLRFGLLRFGLLVGRLLLRPPSSAAGAVRVAAWRSGRD